MEMKNYSWCKPRCTRNGLILFFIFLLSALNLYTSDAEAASFAILTNEAVEVANEYFTAQSCAIWNKILQKHKGQFGGLPDSVGVGRLVVLEPKRSLHENHMARAAKFASGLKSNLSMKTFIVYLQDLPLKKNIELEKFHTILTQKELNAVAFKLCDYLGKLIHTLGIIRGDLERMGKSKGGLTIITVAGGYDAITLYWEVMIKSLYTGLQDEHMYDKLEATFNKGGAEEIARLQAIQDYISKEKTIAGFKQNLGVELQALKRQNALVLFSASNNANLSRYLIPNDESLGTTIVKGVQNSLIIGSTSPNSNFFSSNVPSCEVEQQAMTPVHVTVASLAVIPDGADCRKLDGTSVAVAWLAGTLMRLHISYPSFDAEAWDRMMRDPQVLCKKLSSPPVINMTKLKERLEETCYEV